MLEIIFFYRIDKKNNKVYDVRVRYFYEFGKILRRNIAILFLILIIS